MPKSKSVSTDGSKPPISPFVNYDLTKEDKAVLAKANPSWEQISAEMTQLIKEGYKISLNWDSYSDCLACFLIGTATTKNEGLILTSRANDPKKALASVVYKHKTVFEGLWRNRVLEGRPQDDF